MGSKVKTARPKEEVLLDKRTFGDYLENDTGELSAIIDKYVPQNTQDKLEKNFTAGDAPWCDAILDIASKNPAFEQALQSYAKAHESEVNSEEDEEEYKNLAGSEYPDKGSRWHYRGLARRTDVNWESYPPEKVDANITVVVMLDWVPQVMRFSIDGKNGFYEAPWDDAKKGLTPLKQSSLKTAAEIAEVADTGTRGSQVETMVERGDYETQDQAVAKQKAETAQETPAEKEEKGSQVQTMVDRGDYSQKGEGAAKLARAVSAVVAIAEKDPFAAAKLVRMAIGEEMNGGGASDMGIPVGGKPESVEQGEAAAEPQVPSAAPADVEKPVGGPVPGAVEVKLQETIKEKQQQMDVDKTVVQELSKVLDSATASKKQAADRGDDGKKTPTQKVDEHVMSTAQDPEDHPQKDGDPDWTLYDQSKAKSDSVGEGHVGQEFASSSDTDYKLARSLKRMRVARFLLGKRLAQLQAGGLSKKAAIAELGKSDLAKKYIETKKAVLAAKKQADGGNTSIKDQKTTESDETTRYTGKERGDVSADETADGTTKRLESPETKQVVGEGQSEMDRRHNESVKGSTTASVLSDSELKKVQAELATLNQAVKALSTISTAAQGAVGSQLKSVLASVTSDHQKQLQAVASEIDALVKSNLDGTRTRLAKCISQGRLLVAAAKQSALLMKGAVLEVNAAKQRFNQVSPSFRLAVAMVQNHQLQLSELPAKVAEFIKMTPNELAVAEKVVTSITKTASLSGRPGVSRLPSVLTEHTAMASQKDELDGVFDD